MQLFAQDNAMPNALMLENDSNNSLFVLIQFFYLQQTIQRLIEEKSEALQKLADVQVVTLYFQCSKDERQRYDIT